MQQYVKANKMKRDPYPHHNPLLSIPPNGSCKCNIKYKLQLK